MYYLISDKLAADVTSLQWIDYDWGQLNDERPPVNFPCALIDIAYTECRNLTEAVGALDQLVNVAVTIKLAFQHTGESHTAAPLTNRQNALQSLNVIGMVHTCLQGYNGGGTMAGLARRRGNSVPRRDKLKVYTIIYETRIINIPDGNP